MNSPFLEFAKDEIKKRGLIRINVGTSIVGIDGKGNAFPLVLSDTDIQEMLRTRYIELIENGRYAIVDTPRISPQMKALLAQGKRTSTVATFQEMEDKTWAGVLESPMGKQIFINLTASDIWNAHEDGDLILREVRGHLYIYGVKI